MALLNLDKIILHRTVTGILCPGCDGRLDAVPVKKSWLRRLAAQLGPDERQYQCQSCHNVYKLVRKK